jgi:outer membrane receptor protein involved in Fe transport
LSVRPLKNNAQQDPARQGEETMRVSSLLLRTASPVGMAAALLAGAAAAQAQDAAAPPRAPSAAPNASRLVRPRTVDEIVVTAQKRTESLQNVPIVVTTLNRQLLQDSGVRDIKELSRLTPGLLVTSTTSEASTTARIRGIGTVGDNPGLESSVGVVIDGVYRPRNGVGFGDIGDIERIEVLKGPQGTLFGKSTSAGVINILTVQPSFKRQLNAEFTAGNYGQVGGSLDLTGPLVGDVLAGSLYFADRHRDGFLKVDPGPGPRTETRDNDRNFYTLRGQLLGLPTDDLTLRFIADYTHRTERCCGAATVRLGPSQGLVELLGGTNGDPNEAFARFVHANRPNAQNIIDYGVSLQADYKMPDLNATLTSITGWRDWKTLSGFDGDFSTADITYLPADNSNSSQFRTFSQELRLAGATGKLDWLVGGFFSQENLDYNVSVRVGTQFTEYLSLLFSEQILGRPDPNFLSTGLVFPLVGGVNFPAGSGSHDIHRQDDKTYALFTNDTLHITPKLELNLGLRYTDDEKTLDSTATNIGGGAGCNAANTAVGILAPLVPPSLLPGLSQVNNTLCLPFLSPGFNGFSNHQSEAEHEMSGTAKLAYRFNPDFLAYLSYARGYKAGGFNLDRVQCQVGTADCAPGTAAVVTPIRDTRFPGEFVNSYEIGEKATLLDRKLLFNVTGFYQEFTDFQLNTFTGLVFVVDTVPKIKSQGVDIDAVWLPTRNLSFQGGLTVADTRYDLTAAELAGLQQRTGFLGSRGSRLSLAPLYSTSLSATYTHDLAEDYRLRFNAGWKFSSAYNTGSDLDPGKIQKSYSLVNARVVFGPRDDRWTVELWADNLFDTDYKQVAFNVGFQNVPTNATGVLDAFLGDPRTFGVTLRARM